MTFAFTALLLALLAEACAGPSMPNFFDTKPPIESGPVALEMVGPSLRVLFLFQYPYLYPRDTSGKNRGLLVDILNEVCSRIGYKVEMMFQKRRHLGEVTPDEWNDMVDDISRKHADVGVGAFVANSSHSDKVVLSYPVLHAGLRLLYKIPQETSSPMALVTVLQPFTPGLWVLIVLMSVLVAVGLYVIGRLSPYEDIAFFEAPATFEGLTVANSLLYTFSSMVRQGYCACPRSISGRLLACAWWIFTVMTVSAYIAGLVVILFRVDPNYHTLPFTSLEEAALNDDVDIVVVGSGNAHRYLMQSEGRVEKLLLDRIMSRESELLAPSLDEALHWIDSKDDRHSKKVALLIDGPYAQYLANREPCNKMVIGQPLGDLHYSFVCRKATDVCWRMSKEILALIEDGTINKLKDKWFNFQGCQRESQESYLYHGLPFFDESTNDPDKLFPLNISIERFGVAFIMLGMGLLLSFVCLFVEMGHAKRRQTAVPQQIGVLCPDQDEMNGSEITT